MTNVNLAAVPSIRLTLDVAEHRISPRRSCSRSAEGLFERNHGLLRYRDTGWRTLSLLRKGPRRQAFIPVHIGHQSRELLGEFLMMRLANTLAYVVLQCEADAKQFCPDVVLGEERVLNCLSENQANLSKYCGLALTDVGRN